MYLKIIVIIFSFFLLPSNYQVTEKEREELGEDSCIMNFNSFGPGVCRLLTHVDVSYEDVMLAIKKIMYVVNEFEKRPTRKVSSSNGHTNGHSNGHHMNGSVGYQ